MRSIKIVATIGPKTADPQTIRALVEAGADLARLNGSHANVEWHRQTIATLREVAPHVPILLDLPGRKIRTGLLAHELRITAGQTLILTTDPTHDGREKVPVTDPHLHTGLSVQTTILACDGQLQLTVVAITGLDIVCRAETTGVLRSRKGLNIPSVALHGPVTTERDQDLLQLAQVHGVEFVGVSFVDVIADIRSVRELLGDRGPQIVAKIETQGALERVGEIAKVADALMIDRGDLSIETHPERIAVFQKHILKVARQSSCPVIVATEMLESMVASPRATQAEISDITNAVMDGASALMLSAETAIGDFPVDAVATMRRVADAAWEHLQGEADDSSLGPQGSIPSIMGDAVVLLCRHLPITKIVSITISGYAARIVAARRPRQPIFAVSNDPANARAFNLLSGTQGIYVDIPFSRTSTDHIAVCLEALWQSGDLTDEDVVLVTALGFPKSGNRFNLIQTHRVGDLRDSLQWTRRSQDRSSQQDDKNYSMPMSTFVDLK